MTDDADLWDIARSLYATTPADFVKARNDLARDLKKSGDVQTAQRIAAFKKPSVAADLVNRLARDDGGLADEIADLGARLRAAQVDADAATLRGLDQERRGLVGRSVAWARAEAERSGGVATEAMLRDVEQTVWAAIVDAWAAATVRAGVLVRPLSPGGFGQVDVSGASALDVDEPVEPDRPVRRRPAKREAKPEPSRPSAAEVRARQKASEALENAQASAREAQDRLEEAAAQTEAADARRTDLEDKRDRLRAELAELDRQLREAHQEISEGRTALRQAEKQRRTAAAEVDRALRTLEAVDVDPDG